MSTQYQHIVRILGNDIPGDKKIIVGLTQIRGVGYMFANTILNTLKINPNFILAQKNIGIIHMKNLDWEKAENTFIKVLKKMKNVNI